jgi:hypothetical protein
MRAVIVLIKKLMTNLKPAHADILENCSRETVLRSVRRL